MTLDVFIQILKSHLTALESPLWPHPHDVQNGPALFLDLDDTRALIAELTRLRDELAMRSTAAVAGSADASEPSGPSKM